MQLHAGTMGRLLHDRFVPLGGEDAWDLATGARVRLQHVDLRDREPVDRSLGHCVDWGGTPDGGFFEAWERTRAAVQEPRAGHAELLVEAKVGADGAVIYADAKGYPGGIVEILQPATGSEGLFAMIRDAARGWDGRDPVRRLG